MNTKSNFFLAMFYMFFLVFLGCILFYSMKNTQTFIKNLNPFILKRLEISETRDDYLGENVCVCDSTPFFGR